MMSRLHSEEKNTSLRISILEEPEITDFIDTHAEVLNSTFKEVKMSDTMRENLERSDWMFSGMKTFHELKEAFPSLIDENGDRKPFERFLNDVQKIDDTYNKNYLRAEYNFAEASAQMAARWEEISADGDDYNLQYRTAGDNNVRPEHAALDGVTLPPSDKFWDAYYPPNGWNCRCTAVQVRKQKYPTADHDEAMKRGIQATIKDKKGMFRFNAGKQQRIFPAYNPYTISGCRTCDKSKMTLSDTKCDNCQACLLLQQMVKKEKTERLSKAERYKVQDAAVKWANKHLQTVTLERDQKAKRLYIVNKETNNTTILGREFFNETFAKNKNNDQLALTMKLATEIQNWMPKAECVRKNEPGIDHGFNFNVYRANVNGVTVECKTKLTKGEIIYTMRIIENRQKNKD